MSGPAKLFFSTEVTSFTGCLEIESSANSLKRAILLNALDPNAPVFCAAIESVVSFYEYV